MHILIVRQNKDDIGPVGSMSSNSMLFIKMLATKGDRRDDGKNHESG